MKNTYSRFKISRDAGVMTVEINNPPLNLLDLPMIADLDRLSRELSQDAETKAVVFTSGLTEFFISHADLTMFTNPAPEGSTTSTSSFNEIIGRFALVPQAILAVLRGRAIGGGAEFLLALDMVFADRENATLGFFEVAIGAIPGGGGTQRLPRQVGRGRALEAILGCDEFDAPTAELYGWINRALPGDQLEAFVYSLARRIASFPLPCIAEAKRAVNAAWLPLEQGLEKEAECQVRCLQALSNEPSRMVRFLEAGGQTSDFELRRMRQALAGLGAASEFESKATN